MPLIQQQDVIVIEGARPRKDQSVNEASVAKLQATLAAYPPCRIVAITAMPSTAPASRGPTLIVVVETV